MDSVPLKATDVLTPKQKLPGDGDLHGRLTTHAESRHSKTATKIRFVAVSVSVNQRTLVPKRGGALRSPAERCVMKMGSRIPLSFLSTPKTPFTRPSITIGDAQ
jgi:hypothetical protein